MKQRELLGKVQVGYIVNTTTGELLTKKKRIKAQHFYNNIRTSYLLNLFQVCANCLFREPQPCLNN